MKRLFYLLTALSAGILFAGCKNVNYKKTKSGLVYKIFPGPGKDSLIKTGNVVKLHYSVKYNDSVIYDSHDKMPGFLAVQSFDKPTYDFQEILTLLKKGDSAVVIQLADTLMRMGNQQLPPTAKKGDRLIFSFRVKDVFTSDSLARIDYNLEAEKDRPRAEKEQAEQLAKRRKQAEEEQNQKLKEWEKSGEISKEFKDMDTYLAAKNISAQKIGRGVYVKVDQPGTGAPAADGKWVNVKYTGRFLETDSVFESSTYGFILGQSAVIMGWDDGLKAFKEGGKGTLYVPGFMAYGDAGGPGRKPFSALIFDIELLTVADQAPSGQ